MGKKKLLIAETCEEFRMALQEYLQDTYLVKVCRDGGETLQLLESFQPDLMVLDLLLPGLDGVTLLQRAESRGLHVTVLATTRFYSDYVADAVERLGVGYLMMKPCDLRAVADRLLDMVADQDEDHCEVKQLDPGALVDNALRELSFQTHPRGYACLRQALVETLREPNQQVTKTLYPTVGKLCGGNDKQVEQAIRRLIKQAWLYRDEAVWNAYFAPGPGCRLTACPTNKMFIMSVAKYITTNEMPAQRNSRKIG